MKLNDLNTNKNQSIMKKSIITMALMSVTISFAQEALPWQNAAHPALETTESAASTTSVSTVLNPVTGRTWMDRNLGASRVSNGPSDIPSYGWLFQWGRGADGHQIRLSQTTTTLSTTLTPGHNKFIVANTSLSDWRTSSNMKQDALVWGGVSSINNPCPSGFRLPHVAEWQAEIASWASGNNHVQRAFNSVLKLPAAGARIGRTGLILHVGEMGSYWTSHTTGATSSLLSISSGQLAIQTAPRSYGYSVRCIQN